jgi:hypothetical protein
MVGEWAIIATLAELQQDFWEELIGHNALSGQSTTKPLDGVSRRL